MSKLLQKLISIAWFVLLALVLNNAIAMQLPTYAFVHFINLGFPIYLFLFLFVSVFFIRSKIRWGLLLVVLWLCKQSIFSCFAINLNNKNTEKGYGVLAFNSRYFTMDTTLRHKEDMNSIFSAENISAAILPETDSYRNKITFDSIYKHRKIKRITPMSEGMVCLSKSNVFKSKLADFKNSSNSYTTHRFIENGDTFTFIGFHLQSLQLNEKKLMNAQANFADSVFSKSSFLYFYRKFRKAHLMRLEQVNIILNEIKKSPYPVIASGDMNDVPYGYCYHKLLQSERLKDAFIEKGFGVSNTYKSIFPFFRIDYILVDKRLEVIEYKRLKSKYSDHYPIIAYIKLK